MIEPTSCTKTNCKLQKVGFTEGISPNCHALLHAPSGCVERPCRMKRNNQQAGTTLLHESLVQKAIKAAVQKDGLTKRVSSHTFRHSFATHLLADDYEICTVRELPGHKDFRTTMTYTQVLNRGGRGVRSPADGLSGRPDERSSETAYHAARAVTTKQPTTTIRFADINRLRGRPQLCNLQVIGGNFL